MKKSYNIAKTCLSLFTALTGVNAYSDTVESILSDAIIIDGHNDLPWALRKADDSDLTKIDLKKIQKQFHTDFPRLKKGHVGAQFWSAYVPADTMFEKTSVKMTLEQIDLIHRLIKKYPDNLALAKSSKDIVQIHEQKKIASLIGVEGGHSIAGSLGVLRSYYDLGVRYMTLTHSVTLDWADSATDKSKHNGMTKFGKSVINEMNRLGMFIDISHVSDAVMKEALKQSKAPVIASHSSARKIASHLRNIPDDVLVQIKKNGGVVMVNFYSGFVEPSSAKTMANMFTVMKEMKAKYPDEAEFKKARENWDSDNPIRTGNVDTVLDHIDHIVKVAGIDHVGLGADFDGVGTLPEGLEDVSKYPNIAKGLLKRGYNSKDIKKVLGGNLLRAMTKMEQVASGLQSLGTKS